MANKDLVVKMTINSNDFDNGLKNAKASMNKFNADAKGMGASFKNVIGGMTKAFGALGIAVGGAQMFKTFINSTQTMGDKWNNTMVAAKTSFQTFATAVMSGNNDIIRNFRSLISAANEFAEAQDALGSAKISNRYARLTYLNPLNQALANAGEPGISKKQKQAYINEAKDYYQKYANNVNVVKAAAQREVIAWLNKELPGYSFNESNVKPVLDNLYLNLINGILDPGTKRYKEVTSKEFWKGDILHNSAQKRISGGEAVMLGEGYSRQQIALARLISKQLEIPDERLNENLDILETEVNATAELIQLQKRINRAMGSANDTFSPTTTESDGPKMTPEQQMEYLRNAMHNEILNDDRIKDSMNIDFGIPEEEIFEPETDDLTAKIAEQMRLVAENAKWATEAMASFGGVFGAIGDLAGDDPFGQIAKGLGGVLGIAAQTTAAMMAMAGAENLAGLGQILADPLTPPLMKISLFATALGGILSAAVAIKGAFAGSFADGGIVGGTSYTGDRLIARVNSGEMILNQNQQAALFGGGGGKVQFVIEGSQLKGVLDNFNKIENL